MRTNTRMQTICFVADGTLGIQAKLQNGVLVAPYALSW